MADLARIKRNVAKMAAQNAPETDIDGYIASEGVTVDDVRNYRGQPDMYASGNVKQISGSPQPPPNPMASNLPGMAGDVQNTARSFQSGAQQGMTLGFGDELMAGLMTPIEMGIDAFQGKGVDIGRAYGQALDKNRGADAQSAALNPGANVAGELTGAVVNPLANINLAGKVNGIAKPIVGALEGAAQGGLYGFGKGDTLDQRLQGAGTGAMFGGAIGAAAPAIGGAVAGKFAKAQQGALTKAAIKGAPSAADLRAQAGQMFQAVDRSGVTIDTPKFSQLVQRLASQAKRDRINPNLDPKATGAFQELIGALDDVQKSGNALTMSDMHTLRQIAQKAAVSTEGRDAMFANRIVDGLDDFITQPGVAVLPKNQIGNGNPNQAGNDLLRAISTWGRSRRIGLIEDAIYKAGNQASGVENGLRIQFRQLLQNKKTRSLFTKAEIDSIEAVANGTATSNVLRLIGKFGFEFGKGGGNNMLGGTVGFGAGSALGGPIAGIAAAILGTGARKISAKVAEMGAERAARVVATPNIPIFKPAGPAPSLIGAGVGIEDQFRRLSAPGR